MEQKVLDKVVKQSMSEKYDYPDVFLDDAGLDIKLPDKKLHAVKSWGYSKSNPVRRATLELFSYRGISFNAIHFYGRIGVQGVNMEYDEKPGCSTIINDKCFPLAYYTYDLILKRPVTKEEIESNPNRWAYYYEEGDMTNCFNSLNEIVNLAKEVFRLRFKGNWEFYIGGSFPAYNGKLNIEK